MSVPWPVQVIRAFRDVIDGATDRNVVPLCRIGWFTEREIEHQFGPFVWFEQDTIETHDGQQNHRMTVVTGVIVRSDPSDLVASNLEQAAIIYYQVRAALAQAADDHTSALNLAFAGYAQPMPDSGGVQPTRVRDTEPISTIGERWIVTGSEPLPIP